MKKPHCGCCAAAVWRKDKSRAKNEAVLRENAVLSVLREDYA